MFLGKRDDPTRMARKDYSDESKRDAVGLYRDTDGATTTQIAAELGVGVERGCPT